MRRQSAPQFRAKHFPPHLLSLLYALAIATTSSACATGKAKRSFPIPETTEKVNVQRYLGTWYEVASIPQPYQRGCIATQATYSIRDDGKLRVVNRCRIELPDGPIKTAEGVAEIVDRTTNAKLKVSFFGPFGGDYWIFDVGEKYEYAVVGSPARDALWILSRHRELDPKTLSAILVDPREKGFPTNRLRATHQPG